MTDLARPAANERAVTLRYTHVLADRSTGLARRHPVFSVVLGVAALLRLLAFVAYLPALEFVGEVDGQARPVEEAVGQQAQLRGRAAGDVGRQRHPANEPRAPAVASP